MRGLRAWFFRLAGMFGRERRERALADEIESHLQMHVEHNLRCGMTPEQARRDALMKLGGVEVAKEEYRDRRGVPFLEHLAQDLRFALFTAIKNRGFTAVAALTLALGIGLTAAGFSVSHALFLRPLPYADADRLAVIHKTARSGGAQGLFSYSELRNLQAKVGAFEGVAGFSVAAWPGVLASGDDVDLTALVDVTENFFTVLGVRPFLGEAFAPAGNKAVILSHRLWRSLLGGRTDIIGRQVQVNGSAATVAGVMPSDFQLFRSERPELFGLSAAASHHPDSETLEAVVRLRGGTALPQLRRDLARAAATGPPGAGGPSVYELADLRSHLFGSYRGAFLTAAGAVLFVLLIACVNVGILLLARMTVRIPELSVRVALGASRSRVASQLLIESLVTALLGGGLGAIFAAWAVQTLNNMRIAGYRSLPPFRIDAPVLAFVAFLCLLVPLLCALAPALRFSAQSCGPRLKAAAQTVTAGHWRAGRLFVVLGMAFSFMLLVGAGLLAVSFVRLARVDPGFDAANVVFMDFDDNRLFYTDLPRRQAFYERLVARLRSAPGIAAVGLTDHAPLSDDVWNVSVSATLVDAPPSSPGKVSVFLRSVDGGFFQALRIPLKEGRLPNDRDVRGSPGVAVVNQGFARRVWGGVEPVGRKLKLLGMELTVIGVVGDVREHGLRSQPAGQILYVSVGQFVKGNRVLVARAAAAPLSIVPTIKQVARALEPGAPVVRVRSMTAIISDSISAERFSALLVSGMGLLALALACVGVYALVSFSVSQRTREFAVRTAVGARQRQILALLLKEGSTLVAMGTGLGALGGWAMSRLLAGQLFAVRPGDPLFFVVAALFLAAFAFIAACVPAWRASRADPVLALRQE